MEILFDFEKNVIVNPIQKVKEFYVNPYMLESFKALNLHEKMERAQMHGSQCPVIFDQGLPCLVLPLRLLNLKTSVIKITDTLSGKITTGNRVIYYKITDDETVMRIDTVLFQ